MTSLAKCPAERCPLRLTCLRFTSEADPVHQAWVVPDRVPEREGDECELYVGDGKVER